MAEHFKSDLFFLIKGMSGNEKSYYKKLAKRHAVNNQALHLRLFDLIEKNSAYDEKKIQDHLSVATPARFSSLKNYLGKEVLDTLVFLNRNDDLGIQLSFILAQIEQLLEKKLLQMARKLFSKAWELASSFELYDVQVSLLRMQSRMLEFRSFKEYKAQSGNIAALLRKALHYHHMQQQLHFLFEQLQTLKKITLLRFTDEQHAEVMEIKKALLELKPKAEESEWTLIMQYNALALCEHMLFEFEECRQHCRHMLEFWQRNPAFIGVYPEYFLNSANTDFYNLFALKDIEQVAHHLSAYRLLAEANIRNEYSRKQWEIIAFNTILKINHKTGNYDKVAVLVNEKAAGVMSFARQVLPPSEMLSVITSTCISYFVLGQWKEAEDLIFDIKELNREINREDIFYFTVIFHLLIIYEQKESLRLDSAIEAAYHLLYARKKLRPFEKQIMLFLKRLAATKGQADIAALILPFLQDLDKYKNDPVKKLYFLYFNYYGWLESKMQGVTYRNYIVRKIAEDNA